MLTGRPSPAGTEPGRYIYDRYIYGRYASGGVDQGELAAEQAF